MYRRHSHKVVVTGLIVLGLLLPCSVSIAQGGSTSPEDQTLEETLRLPQTDQSRSQLVDERAQLQQAQTKLEQQRLELERMRLDLEEQKEQVQREIQEEREKLDRHQQESEWTTRIFRIKYASPHRLRDILRMFGGDIMSSSDPNVITVNGSEQTVAAVEAAIQALDVPSESKPTANIQLVVYMIEGLEHAAPADASGNRRAPLADIPGELQPVVEELHKVFQYADYRLLDSLLIRCRDGSSGRAAAFFPLSSQEEPTSYSLSFRSATVSSEGVRLDDFELTATVTFVRSTTRSGRQTGESNIPSVFAQKERRDVTLIAADVDVPKGQKVVVAKASVDMSANALFVVVTAELVD